MSEVVQLMPRLVDKHLKEINTLLKAGEVKQAEEYLGALPVNIRIKINAVFKKKYAYAKDD